MKLIDSLPNNPHLADVFRLFSKGVIPLLEYHDIILRDESPFTIEQREIIAAYVSGLNGCQFCYGAHKRIAESFGVDATLLEEAIVNIETSPIESKLKPILRYVKTLTLHPSKITKSLIDDIKAVGWSDEAIYDAASVCALFNFMNRIVEGMGVVPSAPISSAKSGIPTKEDYRNFGRMIGLEISSTVN